MFKSDGSAFRTSWPVQQPPHADDDQDALREGGTLTVVSRELQRLSLIVSEVAAIDLQRSVEFTNLKHEATNLAAEIVRLREATTRLNGSRLRGDVSVNAEVPPSTSKPLRETANEIAEAILTRPNHSPEGKVRPDGGSYKTQASGRSLSSGISGIIVPSSTDSRANLSGISDCSACVGIRQVGHVEFNEARESVSVPTEEWSSNNRHSSQSNLQSDDAGDELTIIPDFEPVKTKAIWQEPTPSSGKKQPPRSDSQVSWKFRRRKEEAVRYKIFFKCMQYIMLHPGCRKRLSWDIMGFILLCYDMVVIPFQMGFEPEDHIILTVCQWWTLMYWTLDVFMSFISGYQAGELVEMRLKHIAIHYLRTWFAFDIVVLTFDWVLMITEADDSSETASLIRLGRRLRFLRILRLLRLVKMQMIMRDFFEHIQSETTLIFSRIGQLVMSIVVANHLIACGWYKLGTANDAKSWVESNKMSGRSLGYKYWTSLHWSVTQFTPASMEVVPVNMSERIYTVCVVLLAMVAFSSLVSGITNAMTQLRNLNKQRLMEYAVLRRYLSENRISTDLMSNIWGFLDHLRRRRTERTRENEVALLSILPKSLRTELQHEVYWPIVRVHPFFFHFGEVHQWAIRKMYQRALQELSLVVSQEVFTPGEVADRMFFCISGQLTYSGPSWVTWAVIDETVKPRRRNSGGRESNHLQDTGHSPLVNGGDWICEPAMWLESWRYCGKLTARMSSELLGLSCKEFQELVQRELVDVWQPARYAQDFVNYINKNRILLHDFWVDFDGVFQLSMDAFSEEVENATEESTARERKVKKQFSQASHYSHHRRGSHSGLERFTTTAGRLFRAGSATLRMESKMSATGTGSGSFIRKSSRMNASTSSGSKQHGTLYD